MSSVQSATTVAFIDPRVLHSKANKPKGKKTTETEVFISGLLHTTLEVSEVLKIFFKEVQQLVPCDGLKYEKDTQNICFTFGKQEANHCDYRIFTDKDFLGEIFFSRNKRFADNEMALLEALIAQLVTPLSNALKYRDAVQAALKDPLTGAGNRLALDNALKRELQLAQRHSSPLSILMIDIDDFKKVNDTFGHQVGDKVLQNIAESIVAVTRQTDMVFRYGGEEFLVILNKTCAEGAEVIAERIRAFIESSLINIEGGQVKTTVSIGTALLNGAETDDQMIKRADDALFKAKKSGKNQVISAESQKEDTDTTIN